MRLYEIWTMEMLHIITNKGRIPTQSEELRNMGKN